MLDYTKEYFLQEYLFADTAPGALCDVGGENRVASVGLLVEVVHGGRTHQLTRVEKVQSFLLRFHLNANNWRSLQQCRTTHSSLRQGIGGRLVPCFVYRRQGSRYPTDTAEGHAAIANRATLLGDDEIFAFCRFSAVRFKRGVGVALVVGYLLASHTMSRRGACTAAVDTSLSRRI